jgi:hypothetical protein
LNSAIEAMNLAKEALSMTPAKAVFGSVSILLTMIRVRFLLVRVGQPAASLMYTGLHDQQSGLRRPRASLRRCV